jgi:hypothetical protein
MRRPMTSPAGGGSRGRCSQGHSSRAAALARQHLPGWDAQARLRALINLSPCSQQSCGSAAKAAARCHEGEIQRPRHTRLHTARPEQPRPSDAHERSTSPPSLTCAPAVVACVDSRCHKRQGTDNILAASVFRAVLVAGRCGGASTAVPARICGSGDACSASASARQRPEGALGPFVTVYTWPPEVGGRCVGPV